MNTIYMFVKQQYCDSYGLNFTLSFGSNKSLYLKFITCCSVPIEVVIDFKSILAQDTVVNFISLKFLSLFLFNSFMFNTSTPIFNLIFLSKPVED